MRIAVAVSFVLAVAACGGKPAPSSTTPPPTTAAPVAEAALPDLPFDKLEGRQKAEFMKQKVMPAMKPIFQNHDPKKYADFGCKTCHGSGVMKHEFDMPNSELPVLDFADMSKHEKRDIEWMSNEVKPTMAKLLQMPEYTKDNPKGFGCLACHTSPSK